MTMLGLYNAYDMNRIGVLSQGVKWPGCEVSHLSPCSTEIKNEWSYTSTPPTCLHGVEKDKCNSFEQNNWYIKQFHSSSCSSIWCIFQHIIKFTVTVRSKLHNFHPETSCTRLEFIYSQVILWRFFFSYSSVSLVVSSHDLLQPKFD